MTREMARDHFGYGHWEASYWFLGLEEGKGRNEAAANTLRAEAWKELGKPDLSDCKDFHDQIKDLTWHQGKPPLQPTWRPLILLLHSFLGAATHNDILRVYQRDLWGRVDRDTCVIELSGVAAKGLHSPAERNQFQNERIKHIRSMMLKFEPKFIVMYGDLKGKAGQTFKEIAYGDEAVNDNSKPSPDEVVHLGPYRTIVAFTPHPTSYGRTNADWMTLGKKLREKVEEVRRCGPGQN
jgi:hypothetical protein